MLFKETLAKIRQNDLLCRPFLLWFLFLGLVFLVYHFTIDLFFVSDDFHWLWLAQHQDISWNLFTANYEGSSQGGSYNPLISFFINIEYSIFALNHKLYHVLILILHATNAWLVYLTTQKIFQFIKLSFDRQWAYLVALFFLIWPSHVETISWMASQVHLWATLFYLSSLYFYFKYILERRKKFLGFSILSCLLALFSKESTISLPFVILSWELYRFWDYKFAWSKMKNGLFRLVPYFISLIFFLIARFWSTGLLFGYYGRESIGLPLREWLGNLAGLLLDLSSASFFREIFFKIWYYKLNLLIIFFILFSLIYLYNILVQKNKAQFSLFLGLFMSLLPFMPLGLSRTTFEGERYVYLPSIFFLILFVYLFSRIKLAHKLKIILIALIVLFSLILIQVKIIAWQQAGQLSQQIIASYHELNLTTGQKVVTVGLPDNLSGAQVFRNNLQQALELYYPTSYPSIFNLPVYVRLNYFNPNFYLLSWQRDDLGWFAHSTNGSFVVTGQTSITKYNFYFELWNYNYQNFTANLIRLMPQENIWQKLEEGHIKIMTFDQGKLKIVE